MARIARGCGGFETSSTLPIMRAQVQIVGLTDPYGARMRLLAARDEIVSAANAKDKVLISLGGGCRDIEVHVFPSTPRGAIVVMHLLVDVRDAMGANTGQHHGGNGRPDRRADDRRHRAACASCRTSPTCASGPRARQPDRRGAGDVRTSPASRMIDGILDAYTFAAVDPYRATTHNKGIMNGIDPLVVATGNDWRAIEAGAHAWAARDGRYTSLTTWELSTDGRLVGTLEMPMALGLVGGATKTHPLAQLSLRILGVAVGAGTGRGDGRGGPCPEHGGAEGSRHRRHPARPHGPARPQHRHRGRRDRRARSRQWPPNSQPRTTCGPTARRRSSPGYVTNR